MPGKPSKPLEKQCRRCGSLFSTTEKRAWRTHYCSTICNDAWTAQDRANRKEARRRQCVTCGVTFYPRWRQIKTTGARYCSNHCSTLPRLAEMSAKGCAVRNRMLADGTIRFPTGPANKQWRGGPKAARQRAQADGRLAARVRKYRAANPEKTREWTQSRNRRKFGRLPRGTIPALYEKQRGKCAVCRVVIGQSYHTDHITPLVAGGEHVPNNLQLLCQHCNCTKSAKDPIQFMQERGFLL